MARRRQVIELPPPPPIEVTEHVVYHGWCSQCGTWREAPLDVSREVIGQGRMGVKLDQRDCLSAHGDALTGATDPSLSGQLHGLRSVVERSSDCCTVPQHQLEPQLAGAQAANSRQPSRASR